MGFRKDPVKSDKICRNATLFSCLFIVFVYIVNIFIIYDDLL